MSNYHYTDLGSCIFLQSNKGEFVHIFDEQEKNYFLNYTGILTKFQRYQELDTFIKSFFDKGNVKLLKREKNKDSNVKRRQKTNGKEQKPRYLRNSDSLNAPTDFDWDLEPHNKDNPFSLKRRKSPFVWITWLAPFLAGDSICELSLWTQANFEVPRKRDEVPNSWVTQHRRLLQETARDFENDGYTVKIEDENSLKFSTSQGITLKGKPDLVCLNGKGTVVDVKTGNPKNKDRSQVNLYQALIASKGLHNITDIPWGKIVYQDFDKVLIPPKEIDDNFKNDLKNSLSMILENTPPPPKPSHNECRYCKCNEVCTYKIEEEDSYTVVDWL